MSVISCEQCAGPIDPAKVRKGGAKRRPRFCSRQCQVAYNRETGAFHRLSQAGNAAQHAYKAEHGTVPGYESRRAALQRPDRTNNRRKRA